MAPFPHNSHSIEPSPDHDYLFVRFGPLFAAIKGKTWCLEAIAARSVLDQGYLPVLVNAFEIESTGVRLWPVIVGNSTETSGLAKVGLRQPAGENGGKCEVLWPDDTGTWKQIAAANVTNENGVPRAIVEVSLVRRCALVRWTPPKDPKTPLLRSDTSEMLK